MNQALRKLWKGSAALLSGKSLQNLVLYGGATGLGQFFMLVYTLLVARSLGPAQFGTYASCYAATGLSVFSVNWGMDTWMLRESASAGSYLRLAGGVLRNKAALGLAWGAVMIVAFPLIRPDVFSPLLMAVCVIDLWCDSSLNTQVACLNISRKIRPISGLIIVSRLGRLAGAIVVILLGAQSALLFGLVRAAFSLAALLASGFFTRPSLTGLPAFSAIFKSSLPFAASEFVALIYIQADVLILSLMSSKEATGLYSTASGMINALFVIPGVGYLLAIPSLSRLKETDPARLPAAIRRYFISFLGLGVILFLAALLFGVVGLELILGSQYKVSGQLLSLMSPLLLLKSIGYFCATVLVASGLQSKRLVSQAISAGANVLLNIIVIPFAGFFGVAIVYIISEIILTLGYGSVFWTQVWKKMRVI